jgi:hypothetical protein
MDSVDAHSDGFGLFLDEYKDKNYFTWEDIQRLIFAVEKLTTMNNKVCCDLAKALMELDKVKARLEWYRAQVFKQVK